METLGKVQSIEKDEFPLTEYIQVTEKVIGITTKSTSNLGDKEVRVLIYLRRLMAIPPYFKYIASYVFTIVVFTIYHLSLQLNIRTS